MNQTLDWSRTCLLFKKYLYENRKSYPLLFLAIAGFFILWMGVYLLFSNPNLFNERFQVFYYFTGLFLSGCLYGGILFSELGSKPKAINYLMVPVSSLEKFICVLFFGVLGFFIGYSAIFYIIDVAAVSIANLRNGTQWSVINPLFIDQYENIFFEGPLSHIFYIYFAAQALFILASIYFSKHSLFKAIVCLGLLWVFLMLFFMLIRATLPPGWFYNGIDTYEVFEPSGQLKTVSVPSWITGILVFFFKFLVPPLLWIAAYYKLKEKQL